MILRQSTAHRTYSMYTVHCTVLVAEYDISDWSRVEHSGHCGIIRNAKSMFTFAAEDCRKPKMGKRHKMGKSLEQGGLVHIPTTFYATATFS